MLVDKTEFEAWMERIMGELYRISRKLDKGGNEEKHLNYLNGERLYDNQEVCLLLRISKRTLQRYRNNGVLKFYSIYHKTYYKESDLHRVHRNNFDENEIKQQAREDKLSRAIRCRKNKSMFCFVPVKLLPWGRKSQTAYWCLSWQWLHTVVKQDEVSFLVRMVILQGQPGPRGYHFYVYT